MKETLTAETIMIPGHNGDEIEAYLAKPGGVESFAGVVVIHLMPGYDTSTKEITRQFPTPAETAELSGVLDSFSKPHEFHTFEGAGHAFFSVDRPAYRVDAATQGWAKVWEFFGKHLA